jgi:DNA adenine methylase
MPLCVVSERNPRLKIIPEDIYCYPTHTSESIKAHPVRAPFGYYGAKLRIAKQIVSSLPPHNAWVEAFCGSAAITLAKKPAQIEVINDLDGEIVNLFDQLRRNSEALCRAVALTPYSREEFERAKSNGRKVSGLERARRFLVATMMTVNATIGSQRAGFSFSHSYAREGREARVNRWFNLPERLQMVVERLRGIRIENRDACELLDMFADRPATLVYLDPPYFVKRDHRYVIDANDEEFHLRLLNTCKRAKCMIVISGYETELYNDLLKPQKGWQKWAIETHTRDTSGKNYARREVLWTNSQFQKAHETGRVPIRLKANERKNNKINPPRK